MADELNCALLDVGILNDMGSIADVGDTLVQIQPCFELKELLVDNWYLNNDDIVPNNTISFVYLHLLLIIMGD